MSSSTPTLVLNPKTLVRAGAGAGKTTELIERFVRFARSYFEIHKVYPKVVITTFTRKATQEVNERLLMKALELNDELLFNYINNKSQVHISTIHGILSLFLNRYGEGLGLAPEFKIIDAKTENFVARKILRKILKKFPERTELLEDFNFATLLKVLLKLVQYKLSFPSLKGFSLEEHIYYRDEQLAKVLHQIQQVSESLQFATSKPWLDYGDYLKSYFKPPMTTMEFYQACGRFVEVAKSKPRYLAANPAVSEDVNTQVDALQKLLKKWANDEFQEYFDEALGVVAQKSKELGELLNLFYDEFVQHKISRSELSMGDLESFSLNLIRKDNSTAQKFAQSWNFWMLDEYQDTSPVQVELLKNLMGAAPYFVVGDPQQSIYLFRGARREVFFEKETEVKLEKNEFFEKLINYRSHPNLLNFFNSTFARMGTQFKPMQTRPFKGNESSADGCVRVVLTSADLQPAETSKSDSSQKSSFPSGLQSSLNEILHYLSLGIPPEKICVLSRSNQNLEDLADLCKEKEVPIQIHGAGHFFERREIQDSFVFLRFLANPHDDKNLLCLLRQPQFECNDAEIVSWSQAAKKHNKKMSLYTYCREFFSESTVISRLHKYRESNNEQGYLNTYVQFLENENVLVASRYADPSGRREANLFKLLSMLKTQEKIPGFNIFEFIQNGAVELSTDSATEGTDATPVIEPQRVNLMTVHASKGLQFEAVIILACHAKPVVSKFQEVWIDEESNRFVASTLDEETGQFSTSLLARGLREQLNERESEEFERVFYVAVTRAQRYLSLCAQTKKSTVNESSWLGKMLLNLSEGSHQDNGTPYETIFFTNNESPTVELLKNNESFALNALDLKLENKEHKSVTQQLQETQKKVGSQSLAQMASKAVRGTEIHRWFEVLKYRPDYVSHIEDAHFQKALDYLLKQTELPFLKILSEGFVEWGFAIQKEGFATQGQIDLWAEFENVIWILDYKTGSIDYCEKAFSQLSVYAKSILLMEETRKMKEIKLAVLYPFDSKIFIRNYEEALLS